MFYIRKLSKLSTISKIDHAKRIEDIPSDVLKQELPTTNNSLSFWKCDSLDNSKDTIKAILLSAPRIERTQFVIFDDAMLKDCDFRLDSSQQGDTGYLGFGHLHVDFCDLTYSRIGQILSLIKQVINNKDMIPELSRNQVKEYIREVCASNLLDEQKVNESLLSDIKKCNLM